MNSQQPHRNPGKRSTIQYAGVQASFWANFCIIYSFASVYLLSKGLTNTEIGLVIALAGCVSALLQPAVADFADRRADIPLRKIISGIAAIIIIAAAILLIPKLQFLIVALLYGIEIALLQVLTPLISSLGMACINRGVNLNFGVARGIGSLAYAVTSWCAGGLVERFGANVVLVLILVLFSILLTVTIRFRYGESKEQEHVSSSVAKDEKEPHFFARYHRFFSLLMGTTFLFIGHNLINTFVFQIVKSIGGSSAEMGTTLAIAALMEIPAMFGFTYLLKRIRCTNLLRISAVVFTLKIAATILAGSVMGLYAVQLVQCLGFALFTPASVYYVNEIMGERDRIKGQAFMAITNTLGSIMGSFIGGGLIDVFGVPVMLVVALIISGIGMIITWFATAANREK